MTPETTEVVLEQLRNQLESDHRSWGVSGLKIAGTGLESVVFRGESQAFGPIAIRTPRIRWISNHNDPSVDARDLLRQEAALASQVRIAGVAAPKVHALVLKDDGLDFLISDYIQRDGSRYAGYRLGELIRLIHSCPQPGIQLAAQSGTSAEETLALRLNRRLRVVRAMSGTQLKAPSLVEFRAILRQLESRRSLLHMYIRPENILTEGGEIVSVLDWGNALIGDPAIELTRMGEYGLLNRDVLEGYGESDWESQLPHRLNLALRLDAAVMLSIVFLSEAPDAQRARSALQRVVFLCDALDDQP